MKDNHHLHDHLSRLPKYSLDNEQKQKILAELKAQPKNKRILLRPTLAVIASVILFSIVFFGEFNKSNLGNNNDSELKQIELHAQEAKTFPLPETNYQVIGVEGEVALLDIFGQFVAEDRRRGSKLFIYYWGDPSELVGETFSVEAMNRSGETITLSEGMIYAPSYSEDAQTLTSFEPFPTEGEWQLSFFVNEKLHSSFILDVLPPFPETEHYTLVKSPKEVEVGVKTEVSIESNWKDKETIEVVLLNEDGVEVSNETFIKGIENIDSFTNKPLYHYDGHLTFPKRGTWTLMIDGERTDVFEN